MLLCGVCASFAIYAERYDIAILSCFSILLVVKLIATDNLVAVQKEYIKVLEDSNKKYKEHFDTISVSLDEILKNLGIKDFSKDSNN